MTTGSLSDPKHALSKERLESVKISNSSVSRKTPAGTVSLNIEILVFLSEVNFCRKLLR